MPAETIVHSVLTAINKLKSSETLDIVLLKIKPLQRQKST